jgi:hypothetical protein
MPDGRGGDRERALARWKDTLIDMIGDHRRAHPDDRRNDCEILNELMECFVANGVVGKDAATGRWLLPELIGDPPPGRR